MLGNWIMNQGDSEAWVSDYSTGKRTYYFSLLNLDSDMNVWFQILIGMIQEEKKNNYWVKKIILSMFQRQLLPRAVDILGRVFSSTSV